MTKDELRIGMALSGGGVRAAVFHLGILGRLAIDDLLEKITFISTVSGGSLIIGLIYSIAGYKWPTSTFFLDKCLIRTRYYLTQVDIQGDMLRRALMQPWFLTQGRAKLLSQSMQHCWHISGHLNDIPLEPRWILNATTYESGKNWRFIPQRRMGDYVVNYVENPTIALTDTMAASAAYPGLIGPLVLKTKNFNWFRFEGSAKQPIQPILKKIHLWDGGLYDNLGVEALFKIHEGKFRDEYNFLVVSDASRNMGVEDHPFLLSKRALRLINTATDQVRGLRARTLVNHFQSNKNSGVYFKIGNTGRKILRNEGISEKLIDELTGGSLSESEVEIAADFDTTLRKLTNAEYDLLYRHGWEVANFTLQARCPDFFEHKDLEIWQG